MKFLCDVHISFKLVKLLQSFGYEAIHVNDLPEKWHTPDEEICRYADEHDLVVISKDADFRNSHFINNTPKKFIHVTLGNISNEELLKIFSENQLLISHNMKTNKCLMEIGKGYVEVYKN
jgi:predicted nuclease of predicted toxin-antitoxin system